MLGILQFYSKNNWVRPRLRPSSSQFFFRLPHWILDFRILFTPLITSNIRRGSCDFSPISYYKWKQNLLQKTHQQMINKYVKPTILKQKRK